MTICVWDRADGLDVHVRTDRVFPVLLAALFLLVYTQGYMDRVGVPRGIVKLALEVPVFLILLHLINRGVWQPAPGLVLIVLYMIWTVLSAIYNEDEMYRAFLYCRYAAYAYIVFAGVWSTPLTKTAVTQVNTILVVLFLFQIVASAYEVFVLGERVEAHVGALYAQGGELATEFPLLAMALTVPLYFHYRRNPLLLALSWAFLLIGYASAKRAIYFLGPLLYFAALGWCAIRDRSTLALKHSLVGGMIFVCLAPFLLLGVSRSGGISQSGPSRPHERVAYAFHYALRYSVREGQAGRTEGRIATSRRVLSALWSEKKGTALFGWGPSAAMGSGGRFDALLIDYGITGWTRDAISIGVPGMILYMLFHVYLFRHLQRWAPVPRGGHWRALRLGIEIEFFVILVCYFVYSSAFAAGGGQLSHVYFYFLALLMSPQHRHIVADAS